MYSMPSIFFSLVGAGFLFAIGFRGFEVLVNIIQEFVAWLHSASRNAGVPDARTGTWCSVSWRSCSPDALPADPWL